MDLSPRSVAEEFSARLDADAGLVWHFPVESGDRQPVQRCTAVRESSVRFGVAARRDRIEGARDIRPGAATLARLPWGVLPRIPIIARLYPRVVGSCIASLSRTSASTSRGWIRGSSRPRRGSAAALEAADEVYAGMANATLPPFIGIRIKQFSPELRPDPSARSTCFSRDARETIFRVDPERFRHPAEGGFGRAGGGVRRDDRRAGGETVPEPRCDQVGAMIEITSSIFDEEEGSTSPGWYEPQVSGASAPTLEPMTTPHRVRSPRRIGDEHPACDFARHVMQVSLVGTGVWLSDGATANVMPVPIYRGDRLTKQQVAEDQRGGAPRLEAALR